MALRRLPLDGPLADYLDDLAAVPEPIAARYREQAGHPRAEMMSHPELGRLLATLTRATGGRAVLEIGTFVGISAAWMAGSLAPGGRLDTLDRDAPQADDTRRWLDRVGLGDRVVVHVGPAPATLAGLPDGAYDLCYIDADKPAYPHYLDESLRLVRPGGLIVADNVLMGGRVTDAEPEESVAAMQRFTRAALEHPGLDTALLTVADGITVSAVR